MKQHSIYLDYAAATPLSNAALLAMQPFWQEQFYNPSALYLAAKDVKQQYEAARADIARIIGARPGEVVFTAGGSEANNLAIRGIMEQFPNKRILISAVEHDSVRSTADLYDAKQIPVDKTGRLNTTALQEQVDDDTVLISVMVANNEVGTIQPIKDVADLVKRVRRQRQQQGLDTPLFLHTDACQATNYLDVHVDKLGVDLMTINGGKIYGPKQSGCLYVRAGIILQPVVVGGGQEYGLRSGTENVPASVGLAAALTETTTMKKTENKRLTDVRDYFIKQLIDNFPDVAINGSRKHRLPNNVHLTFAGQDNERLLMELDERGIQCATGSACSASKEEASHVLLAMGLSETDARASLRFTLGRGTNKKDIDHTITALSQILTSK